MYCSSNGLIKKSHTNGASFHPDESGVCHEHPKSPTHYAFTGSLAESITEFGVHFRGTRPLRRYSAELQPPDHEAGRWTSVM